MTALLLSFMVIGGTVVSCGKKGKGDGDTTASESSILPADADKCIQDFSQGIFSGDGEATIFRMYPDAVVEGLDKSGMIDQFYSAIGSGAEGEMKKCSTADEVKISDKAMQGAAVYFDSYAQMLNVTAPIYKVSDGYNLNMTVTTTDDGKDDDFTENITVVCVDGEGWKIIPMAEADLEGVVDNQASQG